MDHPVHKITGNRLRVRACGLLTDKEGIILINHKGLYSHDFWAPPGGGINFQESVTNCLIREFKEETGLAIEVQDYIFSTEFIKSPLHAIELFFMVRQVGGILMSGHDPEFKDVKDYFIEVRKMKWNEIKSLKKGELHGAFHLAGSPEEIMDLRGYLIL